MPLKTIRINEKGAALPNNFSIGRMFTMNEAAAAHYVNSGLAEYVDDEPEAAVIDINKTEKAVKSKPKGRSKPKGKAKSK